MWQVLFFMSALGTVFAYQAHNVHHMEIPVSKPIREFSYTNCNTTAVPVYFQGLSLKPDPLQPGQPMTIDVDLILAETIDGKIDYDMDILMKVGSEYISVCNWLPPEACSGTDACTMLKQLVTTCPDVVQKQGSNCQCPFNQKEYKFTGATFLLPNIPGGITGAFKVTAEFKQNGEQLMCITTNFCLGKCD